MSLLVGLLATSFVAAASAAHLHSSLTLPAPRASTDCPCSDTSLCDIVKGKVEREIFGFGASNFDDGDGFDWDTITT
jgi:hypothetical protein